MYILPFGEASTPKVGISYRTFDPEYWQWRYPDKLSLSNKPEFEKNPEKLSKLNFTWSILEYGSSNIVF